MIPRRSSRFAALAFAAILTTALGACDDPTQERIDDAGHTLADIMKKKSLRKFGKYSFEGVKYLNLKNTQSILKHGLQAKIVHNDKVEKAAANATGILAQTRKPKSFYIENMCPGPSFIRKYGDDFRIRISIYSVYFNRQFSLDCN